MMRGMATGKQVRFYLALHPIGCILLTAINVHIRETRMIDAKTAIMGYDKTPDRMLDLIRASGSSGISAAVISNRMKKPIDDDMVSRVQKLMDDGLIEARETGRKYKGRSVIHLYAK